MMAAIYHTKAWKHIHLKYWVFLGGRLFRSYGARPFEEREGMGVRERMALNRVWVLDSRGAVP
jgi:hypothetical protein